MHLFVNVINTQRHFLWPLHIMINISMAKSTKCTEIHPRCRIGRHLGAESPEKILEVAEMMDYDYFQIFCGSPKTFLPTTRSKKEWEDFGEKCWVKGMRMVIHSRYVINLCQPIRSPKGKRSVEVLISDLQVADWIGDACVGAIIHMGKNVKDLGLTKDQAIDNFARGIRYVLDRTCTPLILETGAGVGTEVCTDLEELAKMYNSLEPKYQKRIGFCVDTCHIWAAGYNIGTIPGATQYFQKFQSLFGINKLTLVHFNDSKDNTGDRKDNHADIGFGRIGTAGLRRIAQICCKRRIPLLLETPVQSVDFATGKSVTPQSELELVREMTVRTTQKMMH